MAGQLARVHRDRRVGEDAPGCVQRGVDGAEVHQRHLVRRARRGARQHLPSDADGTAEPDRRDAEAAPGEARTLEVPPRRPDRMRRHVVEVQRSGVHVGKAPGHPGAGHRSDAGVAQVDREQLALVAHQRAHQCVVEHAAERAPVLAPVEAVRRTVGRGSQRLARPLGSEDAPRPGRSRGARLVEDREPVEVRLQDPRHRQVGGGDGRQRRPQVGRPPGARKRQPGAQFRGQRERGRHVTRDRARAGPQVGRLFGIGAGRSADPDRPVLRHARRGPSAAVPRTASRPPRRRWHSPAPRTRRPERLRPRRAGRRHPGRGR